MTVQQAWGPNDTREVQALRINNELYTPDAGFGHNPGQGNLAALGQRLMDKSATAAPRLAVTAVNETLADNTVLNAVSGGVKRWVDQVLIRQKPSGDLRHLGAVSPETLTALEMRGRAPASAILSARDHDVVSSPGPLWQELPAMLRSAEATLLDGDSLVYICRQGKQQFGVIATPDTDVSGLAVTLMYQGAALTPAQLQQLGQLPVVNGGL